MGARNMYFKQVLQRILMRCWVWKPPKEVQGYWQLVGFAQTSHSSVSPCTKPCSLLPSLHPSPAEDSVLCVPDGPRGTVPHLASLGSGLDRYAWSLRAFLSDCFLGLKDKKQMALLGWGALFTPNTAWWTNLPSKCFHNAFEYQIIALYTLTHIKILFVN